ncbi:hypothetical protein [Psychrobacter sp. H7-1]|uniref:hypothetical protein n=1 Tax=Psychrobacter sp. H7-1 TaxID=1569265 RepID=UPI001D1289EF|nr:hypothetical protein [Psychrobacter sp. H7-1]
MRILLSEQSVGTAGLLTNLGYSNDQMVGFYGVVVAATLLALLISIWLTKATELRRPVIFAVALIALGAWIDTGASLNSTPEMFYMSQFFIAFAAVYFMGPMVFEGMLRAIANGPAYIISFSVIFSISQTIGGLVGAAIIQAFTTIRTQTHYADMMNSANLGDPAALPQIIQNVTRQATVAAYQDLFFVMAVMATVTTIVLLLNFAYNRYHKRNPLSKELAILAKMREGK